MDNASRKEMIIKDTGRYSLAQYATQAIGIFTAFFMRKFLGPYQMGIWSLLRVAQGYLSYIQLGIESAAAFRIPFYVGKADASSEIETRNTAFTFMFLASMLSAVCLIIASILLRNHYPLEVIIGILALALYIVLQRIYSCYIVMFRAYRNFSILTKSLLFDAAVNLVLTFLLVSKFKIYGLYIAIIILAILNSLFVRRLSGYRLKLNFVLKRFAELIKIGFPLLVSGFLAEILNTVDNIMIGAMLGVTSVGYYSIALMTRGCVSGLSSNLIIVTIPHMQEVYGKSGRIDDIKKFVTHSTQSICYILTPLFGLVYFVAPPLVEKFLPKYVSGITALQILLLSTIFISCSSQIGQFLVTINKQTRVVFINAIAIVLNVLLNYYFIMKGYGINGVAIGTSLSSLAVLIITLVFAMRYFASAGEIVRFIFSIIFPLIYMISVIYLCNVWTPRACTFMHTVRNCFFVALSSIPLYIYIDKKTHILRLGMNIITSGLKRNQSMKI